MTDSEDESTYDEGNHWQIDKRIPIALLVTLFFQISAALIWATQLNARVGTLENKAEHTDYFGEKLARIDERLQSMKQDVEQIKNIIVSSSQQKK